MKIRGNTLENNAGVGIFTYGAIGALFSLNGESSGNNLDARIERNTVQNAAVFGIGITGCSGIHKDSKPSVSDAGRLPQHCSSAL